MLLPNSVSLSVIAVEEGLGPSLCHCVSSCSNDEETAAIMRPHLNLIRASGNILKCFSHFWLHVLLVPLLFSPPFSQGHEGGGLDYASCLPHMGIWTLVHFYQIFVCFHGVFFPFVSFHFSFVLMFC